jgi:hypothetical protein
MMSLGPVLVEGFLKIHDPNSKEVFVFFFIICKYLNIKKIKIDLIKPKNNKDLSIFS